MSRVGLTLTIAALMVTGACAGEVVGPADAAAGVPRAEAAVAMTRQPERTEFDFADGPIVSYSCDGFDIQNSVSGRIAQTVFFGRNGEVTRIVFWVHDWALRLENSASGYTLIGHIHGPDRLEFASDGSLVSQTSTGLFARFTGAGGRTVSINAGRTTVQFAPDGTPQLVFEAGPHPYFDRDTMCALMDH
jgi:hypothetical protein